MDNDCGGRPDHFTHHEEWSILDPMGRAVCVTDVL